MRWLSRNIYVPLLFCCLAVAGCGNGAEVRHLNPPGWEPESPEVASPPPLEHVGGAGPVSRADAPFNAEQFARELSALFTRAAAEIAMLSAETRIDSEFPSDAAALLDKSATALEGLADQGYKTIEMEILEAYRAYVEKVGQLEDTINLGKGMQHILEDEPVSDPLYALELLEIKKEYWRERLEQVSGQLAAERNKFIFAKEAMLIAQESSIGAGQKAIIESLEMDLKALADDYALRVQSAIDDATEDAGLKPVLERFAGIDITERAAEFESDFESKLRKVQRITGSEQ